ncbi:MAG: DUF3572 domain-containing protein [Xanthobacteraceae bacterium]
MSPSRQRNIPLETAEMLAVQALAFIAQDGERLGRFLAVTGLGPAQIRDAVKEPGFLAGVLDHLAADEALLVAFAEHVAIDPATVAAAREVLAGGAWKREVP